jgi:ribonuclease E
MGEAPTIGTDREGAIGAPAANGLVEPGTDGDPGATAPPHVEHVPIKRKGSRKR